MLVEQCSDCRLYIPYNRLTEVMHGRGQNFYICIYMPQLEQTKLTNVSLLDRNNRNFKQKKKKKKKYNVSYTLLETVLKGVLDMWISGLQIPGVLAEPISGANFGKTSGNG